MIRKDDSSDMQMIPPEQEAPASFDVRLEWEEWHNAGWQALRVLAFEGEEELSRPFCFKIEAAYDHQTRTDPTADSDGYDWHPAPERLLGKRAVLSWGFSDSSIPRRYVCGELEAVFVVDKEGRNPYVELTLMPPGVQAMKNRRRVNHYQRPRRESAVYVLNHQVLHTTGINSNYCSLRDECADTPTEAIRPVTLQWDESDFAFASRTLEQLGITYHFEHSERSFAMVLRDLDAGRERDARLATWGPPDRVRRWPGFLEVRSGAHVEPTRWGKLAILKDQRLEDYSWSADRREAIRGDYLYVDNHEPGGAWSGFNERSDSDHLGQQARLEGQRGSTASSDGTTSYPNLRTGTLIEYGTGDAERLYLVVRVQHVLSPDLIYRAHAHTHPLTHPMPTNPRPIVDRVFRPALLTPRPRIDGVLRGIAAGRQVQEFGTRVWVRLPGFSHAMPILLGQPLANGTKDAIFAVPTFGAEVLIAFEDGDPDHPYIVATIRNDLVPAINGASDYGATSGVTDDITRVLLQSQGNVIALQHRPGVDTSHMHIATSGTLDIRATDFKQTAEAGLTKIDAQGTLEIEASAIRICAPTVIIDAGITIVPGVLKCDTLRANVVAGSSYTRGQGNTM